MEIGKSIGGAGKTRNTSSPAILTDEHAPPNFQSAVHLLFVAEKQRP
ncbi:hypothetical protein [Mycetocola miduiensis]|nr:hypothetical protein [Mycetocola miduiensis]